MMFKVRALQTCRSRSLTRRIIGSGHINNVASVAGAIARASSRVSRPASLVPSSRIPRPACLRVTVPASASDIPRPWFPRRTSRFPRPVRVPACRRVPHPAPHVPASGVPSRIRRRPASLVPSPHPASSASRRGAACHIPHPTSPRQASRPVFGAVKVRDGATVKGLWFNYA